MLETRPNLYDLAQHHLVARKGERVDSRSTAEVSFGLSDCDYSVDRVEGLLSDLL